MQSPWWTSIVQWTIWGIVMTLVMGWLSRGRLKSQPEDQRGQLRHPWSTALMGLVAFAFFAGIAVISNTIGKNQTTTVWTTGVFLLGAFGGLCMLADYFLGRHRLTDRGLQYGKLFGRGGALVWTEVDRVEYSPGWKWFKLTTSQGTTVRVSAMLMGLPEFAREVLAHVAPQRMSEGTAALLRMTAKGHPPSIWG
jgi:hypothetical protein